ncbi:MAG TPA: vitamin K epoxide reductase family protein [Pyrinomonadaceae bacterium]
MKEAPAPSTTRGRALYLFIAIAFLSLIGLADAIYLTVEKLTGGIVQCGISNCEEVLSSSYATIAGIPLAAFGALAYFTVFSLATLAAFGYEGARSILLYVVTLMLAFSIWLFILQAFVIHAFCQFCLLSAGVTLLLSALVALDRFYFKRKYAYR